MKIWYFKKPFFIFCVIVLFFILAISVSFCINKSSNNIKEENEEIIDIEIADPEECECNDLSKIKERNEILKEKYKQKKLIAITFDDGPSQYTKDLVDELKKRDTPATFFILGSEAIQRPDILKFAYDAGNEIGIHSYEHKLFTKLSDEEILEQVTKTKDIINDVTGNSANLIRVPYGSQNKKIKKILDDHELASVLWNVDSLDWKLKNTKRTYDYVMKKVKGNDIILMHDNFKTSVEAATLIIDTLQSKCYTFVTVSEFLSIKEMVANK